MAEGKKKFCNFTRAEDEILIELVRSKRGLYDCKSSEYKDSSLKGKLWKEIAQAMEKPVQQCKTRWKSLRDFYIKKRKEDNDFMHFKKGKWEYADILSFLDYGSNRNTNTRCQSKETETSQAPEPTSPLEFNSDAAPNITFDKETGEINPVAQQTIKKQRARKRVSFFPYCTGACALYPKRVVKSKRKLEDPTELFFKSMGRTVMKFPPKLVAEVKIKVFEVVTGTECRLLSMKDKHLDDVAETTITGDPLKLQVMK